MTHDPIDPTDPQDHEIPELFDRLESRVVSPDPDAIRAEAGRRGAARRRTLSMAGAFVLVAAIAGGALWMTRETPSETATTADATVGDRLNATIIPPVARDSAPVQLDGLSGLQAGGLRELEWLRLTTIVPPDLPLALTVAPVSGHLWFDKSVDGQGELTFARPCSRATYWILHSDDGFTVVDERSETANLPSPPGDATVVCIGPASERRIDLFAKSDQITYDAGLSQFEVTGPNGQFSFTLGSTDATNLVIVPELTALRVDEAINILESQGLTVDEPAKSKRSLVVLSTDPPAGVRVPSGAVVTIRTETVEPADDSSTNVPELAGKEFDVALNTLFELDLRISRIDEANSDVPQGIVIRTDPLAGAELRGREIITLVISSGPPSGDPQPTPTSEAPAEEVSKLTVPDVEALLADSARQYLTASGFNVLIEFVEVTDPTQANRVVSQTPAANVELNEGDAVTIVVGIE